MKRRYFILAMLALAATPLVPRAANAGKEKEAAITTLQLSDSEWTKRLTPQQYHILREEGTERAHSSPLNKEERQGLYVCAGCELPLFESSMKYDSGTGWPSFFITLSNAVETKIDFKLFYPRTEYHCARCGGHQGHVFDDGPDPTGKRYCNNGLALTFVAEKSGAVL